MHFHFLDCLVLPNKKNNHIGVLDYWFDKNVNSRENVYRFTFFKFYYTIIFILFQKVCTENEHKFVKFTS